MAQAPSSESLPRYVATWTAGVPFRLTQNVDFDQGITAPVFTDVFAAYAFTSGRYQHGLGLGMSLNLTSDGGFTEPVEPAEQFLLMPAYAGYFAIDRDWLLLGHLGVPVLLTGGTNVGFEVAAGLGYRLLSGMGVFAEAGIDAFPGADSTLHLSVSAELGLFVDYEVLP